MSTTFGRQPRVAQHNPNSRAHTVRRDHKPYPLNRLISLFETWWLRHFIAPQLDALGGDTMVMKPWHLKLYGKNIRFGRAVHVITSKDRTVRLTTWAHDEGTGSINVGDYALLCPGVRIDSASEVNIGSNTMLAAGVYLTDADWHGIYDRPRPIGNTSPIDLADNVWIGDGAIVCKGVEIGANTIVGAGSVVTKSLPANVIAAGNPAKVVRALDPQTPMRRRCDLLSPPELAHDLDLLEQMLRKENSWWDWLRANMVPNRND